MLRQAGRRTAYNNRDWGDFPKENNQLYVRKCSQDKTLNKNSMVGCSFVPRRDHIDEALEIIYNKYTRPKEPKLNSKDNLDKLLSSIPNGDNNTQNNAVINPITEKYGNRGDRLKNATNQIRNNLIDRAKKNFSASHIVDAKTREYAVMSNATYKMHKRGIEEAQRFIDEKLGAGRFLIDEETSNRHMLTIIDENDGKAIIAYRGSVSKGDWAYNTLNLAQNAVKQIPKVGDILATIGNNLINESHSHIRKIEEHYQEVSDMYEVKHFTGHSKAGLFGLLMSSKHNIPSDVFNPEIFNNNHNILNKIREGNIETKIHRTTHDVASWGIASYDLKNSFMNRFKDSVKSGIRNVVGDKPFGSYELLNNTVDSNLQTTGGNESIDIRTYAPLSGNENPLHAHNLDNFIEAGNENQQVRNNIRRQIANQATQQLIGGAVNFLASQPINEVEELLGSFVDNIVGENSIDPELKEITNVAITNGASSAVTEGALRNLGMGSVIGGRKISLANAGLSGAVGAVIGAETQVEAEQALINAGMDRHSAHIIASGAGGGANAGSSYGASVALAYIEKKYGSAVLTNSVRSAIVAGVERVGLTEGLMILGRAVGKNTLRGSRAGAYGTAAGVGIGLLFGVVDVVSEINNQERVIFTLQPGYNHDNDAIISSDNVIHNTLQELNSKKDGTNDDIDQQEALEIINNRIAELKEQGLLPEDYNYEPNFIESPEHLILARDKFTTDTIDELNRRIDGVNDTEDVTWAKQQIDQRIRDMLSRGEVNEDNFYTHYEIIFDETQNKYDIKSNYMLKGNYDEIEQQYEELNNDQEIVKIVDLYNRQNELTDEEQAELDNYLDRFENEIGDNTLGHLQTVAEIITGVNHNDLSYVQEENSQNADAYEYIYSDMP